MNINSFNIDVNTLPATATTRRFTVSGSVGAQFTIIAIQHPRSSSLQTLYYDFRSGSFESGYNDMSNNLVVTLKGNIYNGNIAFPAASGGEIPAPENYVIKLISTNGTTIQNSNKNVITKNITQQAASATVTFRPGTSSATSAFYTGLPTTTTTNPIYSTAVVNFDWDVTNTSHNSYGYGLRLTGDYTKINDSFWYFQTTDTVDDKFIKTDTVDGATSSTTAVTLDTSYVTTGVVVGDYVYGTGVTDGTTVAAVNVGDDVKDITLSAAMSISDGVTLTFVTPSNTVTVDNATNIGVGTTITGVSTGSLTGEPRITAIDTINKIITLNSDQAFVDGITLTYRAYGSNNINKAVGLKTSFELYPAVTPTTLLKQLQLVVVAQL